MKKINFVLYSCILLLVACGPKINNEQQKRLEEITKKVDSITEAVNEIDSVALETMMKAFFEKKHFLQEELRDTIPYHLIFKLDSFVEMRREMGFIQNEFNMIRGEANVMKSQIEDLNHDVESRLVEENQFERYYELEMKNTEQLQDAAGQLLYKISRVEKNYPRLVPVVDSIINSYKSELNE